MSGRLGTTRRLEKGPQRDSRESPQALDRRSSAGSAPARPILRGARGSTGTTGDIHRVSRRFAQEDAPDFLGGLGPQLVVSLDAVKRRVWRQEDAGMLAQPVVIERL